MEGGGMKEAIQIVDGHIECPHCCGALRMVGIQEGSCSSGHRSTLVAFQCVECSKLAGLDFHGSHDEKRPGTRIRWVEPQPAKGVTIDPLH
jgi:hypothetical protein